MTEPEYSNNRIINLIPLIPYLRHGEFPKARKASGYTTAPLSRGRIDTKAKFIEAAELYVEVMNKIERAGLDGLLLEMAYSQGGDDRMSIEQHIASALRIDMDEADRRINNALLYTSI